MDPSTPQVSTGCEDPLWSLPSFCTIAHRNAMGGTTAHRIAMGGIIAQRIAMGGKINKPALETRFTLISEKFNRFKRVPEELSSSLWSSPVL